MSYVRRLHHLSDKGYIPTSINCETLQEQRDLRA